MKAAHWLIALTVLGLSLPSASAAEISRAKVERLAPDALSLTWSAKGLVDVYEADSPDATLQQAHILARGDGDGAYAVQHAGLARHYFLLVDQADKQMLTVAERVVPLAQGSNFRDIGGYDAAGGKHVRWGLIYRSAGQPMLSADDLTQIKGLGLTQLIDLRSSEERVQSTSPTSGSTTAAGR